MVSVLAQQPCPCAVQPPRYPVLNRQPWSSHVRDKLERPMGLAQIDGETGKSVELPKPNEMSDSTTRRWQEGSRERRGATTPLWQARIRGEQRGGERGNRERKKLGSRGRRQRVFGHCRKASLYVFSLCVFTFVGSMGASNLWSAGHLDIDFSQLAHWCSAAAWGCQRLTPTRQYSAACLHLLRKWPVPLVNLCTPTSVKRDSE